ncbi:arsenic resistance N-acetyltransferase ArsN2 [Halolamina sp.]|jgi:amino-acid N-acetyltransferase|uniref:arsenic resistance N-acetyltransferase ArsN2 n=1 Tax=Halolamina sp. TaxID=1940283 RepID=UPI000223BB5C|nr:GCN5-related N-acetyltransferase [halophilic archaeon DL31]
MRDEPDAERADSDNPTDDGPAVDLVPATGSGVEWVHRLLESADLPVSDLNGPQRDDGPVLSVVRADPGRVGCIGIERYGEHGLLRSAVVRERYRGDGYGRAAVRAVEAEASDAGIESLSLLTTTAADFFAALGCERVERSAIPEPVRGSAEFSDLCPDSAVVMYRPL